MRHVDHAHHAEGDGQADRRQYQHRTEAEPEEQRLQRLIGLAGALDLADRYRGGSSHRRIGLGIHQLGQPALVFEPAAEADVHHAVEQRTVGREAVGGTDFGAQRQAQAALKVLEDLQAAGENTYGFEGLAKGLQSIEMAAKDIEQTRAEDTIRSLHDEITALEQKLQGVSQVDVTLTMDEAAKAKLISDMEALAAQLAQTLTIKPTVVGVAAPASEPINGYATGGHIRGPGTGTSDSILARLSNGEFVMRAAAVRAYGPDFMHKLNGLQIPRFAEGGLADTATNLQTAPRNLGSLDISVGGDTFQVFTDSSQADQLRLAARKHGRTHR